MSPCYVVVNARGETLKPGEHAWTWSFEQSGNILSTNLYCANCYAERDFMLAEDDEEPCSQNPAASEEE